MLAMNTKEHLTHIWILCMQEQKELFGRGFVIKTKEHLANFRAFEAAFGENGARSVSVSVSVSVCLCLGLCLCPCL
jgi:hypothetical protein